MSNIGKESLSNQRVLINLLKDSNNFIELEKHFHSQFEASIFGERIYNFKDSRIALQSENTLDLEDNEFDVFDLNHNTVQIDFVSDLGIKEYHHTTIWRFEDGMMKLISYFVE